METRERPERGSVPDGRDGSRGVATKGCPRCGEVLFEDMDVCYGCLYDFRRRPYRLPDGLRVDGEEEPAPVAGGRAAQAGGSRVLGEGSALGALEEPDLGAAGPAGATEEGAGGDGPHEAPPRVASGAAGCAAAGCATAGCDGAGCDGAGCDGAGCDGAGCDGAGGCGAGKAAGGQGVRQLCLRVQTEGADVLVPVTDAGITVGRDPTNDVVLHASGVSRHHLRMSCREGGVRVIDLGATNPALHDGVPLEGEVSLVPGDAVDVCGARLALVLGRGARPSRAGVR